MKIHLGKIDLVCFSLRILISSIILAAFFRSWDGPQTLWLSPIVILWMLAIWGIGPIRFKIIKRLKLK